MKGFFVQELKITVNIIDCNGKNCTVKKMQEVHQKRYDYMRGDDNARYQLDDVTTNGGKNFAYDEAFAYPFNPKDTKHPAESGGRDPEDTFGWQDMGKCTKGTVDIEGTVHFYSSVPIFTPPPQGQQFNPPEDRMMQDHPQTFARGLPAVPRKPGVAGPKYGPDLAPAKKHSLNVKWDCPADKKNNTERVSSTP